MPADIAREDLARIARLKMRLLGDPVLRRRAWEIATQLGWASTYDAEYLARSATCVVEVASIDALSS